MSLETINTFNSTNRFRSKFLRLFNDRGRNIIIIFIVTIVALSIGLLAKTLSNTPSSSATTNTTIQAPKATANVNKEFSFPVKNDKGEKISDLKISILDAQLTNEIIVKGQKATAIASRQFLIINLKIANDSSRKLQIDTRDYLRLSVNGNDKELLAPDIHNDPVEVQAISTKFTRLGFPININDKNLKLKVGEINGDKTNIDLNF